jgi:hypothetical protein
LLGIEDDWADNCLKLADGLNLRNQEISVKSNRHLVTLTKDTVDDSATVRAVTFVTLIYLPATFISVSSHIMFHRLLLTNSRTFTDILCEGTSRVKPLQFPIQYLQLPNLASILDLHCIDCTPNDTDPGLLEV